MGWVKRSLNKFKFRVGANDEIGLWFWMCGLFTNTVIG